MACWCAPHPPGGCYDAQVVYFRANQRGACDYVNDSRYWRYSHGTCWSELAADLTVVDVPGDHFSLLRQVGGVSMVTWWLASLAGSAQNPLDGRATAASGFHMLWVSCVYI